MSSAMATLFLQSSASREPMHVYAHVFANPWDRHVGSARYIFEPMNVSDTSGVVPEGLLSKSHAAPEDLSWLGHKVPKLRMTDQ